MSSIQDEISHSSCSDWVYFGEGAVNIICRYIGQQSSILQGYLLRIPKCSKDVFCRQIDDELHFNSVMSQLLQPSDCISGLLVAVSCSFLTQLAEKIQSVRPKSRSGVSILMNTDPLMCICVRNMRDAPSRIDDPKWFDLADENSPIFSFEIKPKFGSTASIPSNQEIRILLQDLPNGISPPPSKYIDNETISIKRNNCRFALHQRIKVEERTVPSHSCYNPLDLYSMDPSRMLHAVRCMLKTPQNNLRFFVDGSVVELGCCEADVVEGIIQSIITKSHDEDNDDDELSAKQQHDDVLNSLIISLVGSLRENGTLEALLRAQQRDMLDVELTAIAVRLLENRGFVLDSLKVGSVDSCRFRGQIDQPSLGLLRRLHALDVPLSQWSDEDLKSVISNFLVATTAKDVSILVKMAFSKGFSSFVCRLSIIDLDPRPISAITRRLRDLDRKIVDSWRN